MGSGGCFFEEIIAIIQLSTFKGLGFRGLGTGDWGLGTGDWGLGGE
ncbi:hypothetical protein GXM_04752 [Nostoc sphaeroides CCNUC1]|uniref:Uncharacterized protein n=1 Tax=Nostoc sphaeroides CCNUC1 TaxID=2653204 RepID=A0A5P8W3P1_9NOSO|nr:hypothetical protein GXM_04752 [Nostoc sphaeroides CCNUC1]